MKKIDAPIFDDQVLLDELSANQQLISFPHLRDHLQKMKDLYTDYEHKRGNALLIERANIPELLKAGLRSHYKSPPRAFSYLKTLRDLGSALNCPMCGGFGTGTLDHVFPKENFAEYAIFTRNLVPACICNSYRLNDVTGFDAEARILHPYFDNCLSDRVITCRIFGNNFETPSIEVRSCCGEIPEKSAIDFHIDAVVKKTKVLKWLGANWASLIRTPKVKLPTLPSGVLSEAILVENIQSFRAMKDEEFESPNNWTSIFYSGLLDSPGIAPWLVQRINNINNGVVEIN